MNLNLNLKSLLVSKKYDLEDALNEEQAFLENLLLTDSNNRAEISNRVERIEFISQRISDIDSRINQIDGPEQVNREENRENAEATQQEPDDDLPPLEEINQGVAIPQENQPFFLNQDVLDRFSHIFANAGVHINAPAGAQINEQEVNEADGSEDLIDDGGSEDLTDEEDVIEINPLMFDFFNRRLNVNVNGGIAIGNAIGNGNGNGNGNVNQNMGDIFQQLIQLINRRQDDREYEFFSNLQDVQVPIKDDVLKTMKTVKYSTIDQKSKGDRNVQCSICLCEYEDDDLVNHLQCDHIYHNECINQWFKTNSKCPVCKSDMNDQSNIASKNKPKL
jgi:hypothetical protein